MPDLLERRIKQAIEAYPRHEKSQHVRRRVILGRWRHTANPEDHDPAELIDAADRRAGIVDCGRHCAQRDIDDLDDAELDILLHGARWTNVEGGSDMVCAVGWQPLWPRHAHERNAGWDELADATLQIYASPVVLSQRNQVFDIDIADIAGLPIEDDAVFWRRHLAPIRQGKRATRIRHEFTDDPLGLSRNSITI